MAKKVLITGAAGLIGRELCRQLSQNHQVIAVDNNFRYPEFIPCGEYIQADLANFLRSTENDFDYVFHMGAINGTKYFYEIPNDLIKNNITLDLAVFDFMKKNTNSKLIYASSSEVIAGTTSFPSAEETDISISNIHNPRWSYRLPKILSENYLFNSDINFLIVRFFNVYSENSGEGHFVYDIIKKINAQDFSIIGDDETRSFCYVEDAVWALLQLYESCNRDIFNLGSDEELKIIDAANIIAEKLGKNITWTTVPGRAGSVNRRVPDLTKLRTVVPDYDPRKFREIVFDKF